MHSHRSGFYCRTNTGSLMRWRRSCSAFFDAAFIRSPARPDCAGSRPLLATAAITKRQRKGPPVSPDLPLPDPCAVQPRSTTLSTTSHRTLPPPQEVREPFARSRRETASFHKGFTETVKRRYIGQQPGTKSGRRPVVKPRMNRVVFSCGPVPVLTS